MADENLNYNPTLDEIVFEHRNKNYGAYDLRTKYPKILTRSFLIGTALFLLLVVSPLIYLKIQQMAHKDQTVVQADLIDIKQDDPIIEQPKDEPPPPPPPKVEEKQEIIQNVVPEPTKVPKIETPPPTITQQQETTTGLINQQGVKNPEYTPPPPPSSSGKSTTVEVKQPSTSEVYDSVDQIADFNGGINVFRKKFQNSFNTDVMEGDEGVVKTTLIFVVERDGSISDVKADGPNKTFNAEAIRTLKAIKDKWTPGKLNGQEVRSRFRFPVTMNFE